MRTLTIVPATLFLLAVLFMLANPSGQSIGQGPTTLTATATPDPPATQGPGPLPPDLSGAFTYRSRGELITVALPSTKVMTRQPAPLVSARQASADGVWEVLTQCEDDEACTLSFFGPDGITATLTVALGVSEWSLNGHSLALSGALPGSLESGLFVIDDPAVPVPRRVFDHAAPFAWLANGGLLAAWQGQFAAIAADGTVATIAASSRPVQTLYPSPDGRTFAFTQSEPAGWRLWIIDTDTGTLRDLGNMGSDAAGTAPPDETASEQKTSMYIAWSPDGARLAFGGGYEPPYTMMTIELATAAIARTEFPHGYPGEIEWSPDGMKLAVSTYDPERTRHESYVVDPATGIATHLLSGCVIVWSPDSRFLAVHGEPDPGITIVDVDTGAQGKVSNHKDDIPWRWEP